ncbi:MAG: ankyrin repeat domain-containing protein [Burkholderiaceae bacterium]|jgi:ankyrin repeat protein|nr:ankyrin repeat domain-containing protein [Burkholderiaceae bacterium]
MNTRTWIRLTASVFLFFFAVQGYADTTDDFLGAVEVDYVDKVSRMLKEGVNPNTAEDGSGNTGLIVALFEGSMRSFQVILENPFTDINHRARNGNTALMVAVFKSNMPAIQALLARNAVVNQPGWTALHYAAATGNEEIMRILLDKKAQVDATAPNGTTPLMMAARSGHIRAVKLLLDHGADVRLKNEWHMSAIDFARDNGFSEIETGLQSRLDKIRQMAARKH